MRRGFPAPAACPGRASTCTRSPGTNPSAGSCPPFTATPTCAIPAGIGSASVTIDRCSNVPGSRATAARSPTTDSRLAPAIAVMSPATSTVDRSDREITAPTATGAVTTTTGSFDPAEEYRYPNAAPIPITSTPPRAVHPVRRCRVGNGVRADGGAPAVVDPLVETCGRSTPFTVRVGVFT